MNGIIGMTELALETNVISEQREYLGMVKMSADSLLSLINDILDFSKIEAGKLDLDSTYFTLRGSGRGVRLSNVRPDLDGFAYARDAWLRCDRMYQGDGKSHGQACPDHCNDGASNERRQRKMP